MVAPPMQDFFEVSGDRGVEVDFPLWDFRTTPTELSRETRCKALKVTIKNETKRLTAIFRDMPENEFKTVQGLITEAARLRVFLDMAWADIEQNGRTELFTQSANADPYERERPVVKQYMTANKNYQSIIKQLTDMVPQENQTRKLEELMQIV